MANPVRHFDRYREIVPDFEAFSEALGKDAPDHARVNTDRATVESVLEILERLGAAPSPEPWFSSLLRIGATPKIKLGATFMHALGHIYLQSASSAVSALCLEVSPGDRVLDLCAAPGSKTTLLASLAGPTGAVVANEPSAPRLTSLVANIRRMGLANVAVTSYMGQNFPTRMGFDRVLVDAPCSGEGTWRGPDARPRPMGDAQRENLARRQAAILDRAASALKPGGRLVYSTCTYAPEENEMVVAEAVLNHGLKLVPTSLPISARPGLKAWGGAEFPSGMDVAMRLYPHYFDSEGFFVACMVKPG